MHLRIRTALPLAPLLLALWILAGRAQAAPSVVGLDPSFGESGIARVVLPKDEGQIGGFAVGPGGQVYVLDGSLLLAFQEDGSVESGFGEDGRVEVAPSTGEGGPVGLVVDSQGRILIAGSIQGPITKYWPPYTTYVIRILTDGRRDPSFGRGGEIDTVFGLPSAEDGSEGPSVEAASIAVDRRDRPVIGGTYGKTTEPCAVKADGGPSPFVARLTSSGQIDGTFAKAGHRVLDFHGGVISTAQRHEGGLVVFSRPCPGLPRVETRAPLFTDLTERGNVVAPATHGGLPFTWSAPLVGPNGLIVELENPPPAAIEYEPDALLRFLPNGRPDGSFGRHGRVLLRKPGSASAFAVDAAGRPIVASAAGRIELRRFRLNGKPDKQFGPGGRLTAKGTAPSEIAFDARGRIYTVSLARNTSRNTVQIARFIPGSG